MPWCKLSLSLYLCVPVTTLYICSLVGRQRRWFSALYENMVYKSARRQHLRRNRLLLNRWIFDCVLLCGAEKKNRFIGNGETQFVWRVVFSAALPFVDYVQNCVKRPKSELVRPIIGGSSRARRETPGKGANSLMHYKRGRMDMEIASTLGARHPREAMSYLHKYT